MWRRLLVICTLGALAGIFILPLNPVNSRLLNLAFLTCIVGAGMGLAILFWKHRWVRLVTLILPLLTVLPILLPSGEIKGEELREDYVRRMSEFEGTKYVWGGESSRGIDCSGLPRKAFRDALLSYGVRHLNGSAFRCYLEQWWFDTSAKALAEGYRNFTDPLETKGTIKEMSYEGLVPGDLAVTVGGVHVLAYLGKGLWIQADPGIDKVATLAGRTDDSSWFATQVTTHRWRLLATE